MSREVERPANRTISRENTDNRTALSARKGKVLQGVRKVRSVKMNMFQGMNRKYNKAQSLYNS